MRFVLDHLVPDGPVYLVGDDTVDEHKGAKVCGCEFVPLRGVFVRDVSCTNRGEYFFTTDRSLAPTTVIGH